MTKVLTAINTLAFQRPDDVARCVLALDARGQVRLRDCVLARRRPWLAEIRERTYAGKHSDRGSMAVVMSAAVVIVAVVSIAVAGLASLYSARAQAQTAADAAALAAAVATYPAASSTAPVLAARNAAGANGAVVVRCGCPVDPTLRARVVELVTAVRAEVPVFGEWLVHASSRAEFDPMRWLGG